MTQMSPYGFSNTNSLDDWVKGIPSNSRDELTHLDLQNTDDYAIQYMRFTRPLFTDYWFNSQDIKTN